MPVDLIAGFGAFKSVYDAAKALKDMNDATVRNAAVIELQAQILNAQEQQAALIRRTSEKPSRAGPTQRSIREAEMEHVAVGDDIVLALETPAACGALAPFSTVHARVSFGPTVKKVTRWSRS